MSDDSRAILDRILQPRVSSMAKLRAYYATAGTGYVLSAISTTFGSGPRWPNHLIWTGLTSVAALALYIYAIYHTAGWRRLAVVAMIVSSGARIIGWQFTPGVTAGQRLGSIGVYLIVASMAFVTNEKARRLMG